MGFRKLEELKENVCRHPEHNPPTMISLPPGKYEYTCPGCGTKRPYIVQSIKCESWQNDWKIDSHEKIVFLDSKRQTSNYIC